MTMKKACETWNGKPKIPALVLLILNNIMYPFSPKSSPEIVANRASLFCGDPRSKIFLYDKNYFGTSADYCS